MNPKNDILRRKAEAAKIEREARTMSPRRGLCRSLCRAAELGLNLPLSVSEVQEIEFTRDSLLAAVEGDSLLVILDHAEGAIGLVVLDLQMVASLVEVQTLGQVAAHPASGRQLTRTDAAVAMPLIDGTLAGFDRLLIEEGTQSGFSGFHFGAWVKDNRALAAQLPDGAYTCFRLATNIGAGERAGYMMLALPTVEVPPEAAPPKGTAGKSTVRSEVLEAPVRLETVLHRLELSLDEIGELKPGDTLPLPLRAFNDIKVLSSDRKPVATGVLGQIDGYRAIRLAGVGQPRIGAPAAAALEQAANSTQIDLADHGLVAPSKPRRPAAINQVTSEMTKVAGQKSEVENSPPSVPATPELSAKPQADPTGTEALLSELGMSDLPFDQTMSRSFEQLPASGRETGSFVDELPAPVDKKGAG